MKNKWFCNPGLRVRVTDRPQGFALWIAVCLLTVVPRAAAGGDAPPWMHALVKAPLPAYDEKTDAVLLYSEIKVTVISADKMRTEFREAYKILRPNGREHGIFAVSFNPQRKIKSLHGWCIPALGKDYEVKDKDAIETSVNAEGAELISDTKYKVVRIPAAEPGNIVGYEFELEGQPIFLQSTWEFQGPDPVREGRYSVELPPGWEYKASWLNHPEVQPTRTGSNSWQWAVSDVKAIRAEPHMPPVEGVAGAMIVSFFTASGTPQLNTNADWATMGKWYSNLVGDRINASAAIKQKVAELTALKTTASQKMQAIATFLQHDIRYVAISLGIGGVQPHAAADVYSHHYGDCKDKATLMRSMLREIGVDSYSVIINAERGSVTRQMPAHDGFNHLITAIKLPEGLDDSSLIATTLHPKLGKLLFFDPTNELIPFGQIGGYLQANYGLLVTPEGGELIELPQQPSSMNSIQRTAKLTLDSAGTLKGDVKETRLGESASSARWRLRTVTAEIDRIKPIEELLSGSLSTFRITRASSINLQQTDQPFGFNYSFESLNYAKAAGNLLLVATRNRKREHGISRNQRSTEIPHRICGAGPRYRCL
jgi:hypothetical protein